jgi:hypothetical protein
MCFFICCRPAYLISPDHSQNRILDFGGTNIIAPQSLGVINHAPTYNN